MYNGPNVGVRFHGMNFSLMMFYEYISSVKINESIEYLSNEIVGLICNHQIGLS